MSFRHFWLLLLTGSSYLCAASKSPDPAAVPDCGAQCVRYLSRYYGKPLTLDQAREVCDFREGSEATSLLQIKNAFKGLGLHTFGFRGSVQAIFQPSFQGCSFVTVVEENKLGHYVVVTKTLGSDEWILVDPSRNTARMLSNTLLIKDALKRPFLAVRPAPFAPLPANASSSSTQFQSMLVVMVTAAALAVGFAFFRKSRKSVNAKMGLGS